MSLFELIPEFLKQLKEFEAENPNFSKATSAVLNGADAHDATVIALGLTSDEVMEETWKSKEHVDERIEASKVLGLTDGINLKVKMLEKELETKKAAE